MRPHANIQPCGGIFSKVVKLLFKFISFFSELWLHVACFQMIKLEDDVELIHELIEEMASSFATKIERKKKSL